MNILIPMAGEGSRFRNKGYSFPKPLIDINGKIMIQHVVENMLSLTDGYNYNFIFLVRKEHIISYPSLITILSNITNNKFKIVEVDKLTEGAACTALLAKELINNNEELVVANSDQIIEFNKSNFKTLKSWINPDIIFFTFKANHPKWSYAKLGDDNKILQVAEKNPISDNATCGIYFFKSGRIFVEMTEKMIRANDRTNNEFYIAPCINYKSSGIALAFFVEEMHGLGTPEDLEVYLNR